MNDQIRNRVSAAAADVTTLTNAGAHAVMKESSIIDFPAPCTSSANISTAEDTALLNNLLSQSTSCDTPQTDVRLLLQPSHETSGLEKTLNAKRSVVDASRNFYQRASDD